MDNTWTTNAQYEEKIHSVKCTNVPVYMML